MIRRLVLFLAPVALVLVALVGGAHAQTRKIQFTVRDTDQLAELEATGAYEIVEVDGHECVALETPGTAIQTPTLAGLKVLMPDIDEELAEFRRRGDTGKYHTVASSAAELKALAAQHPSICQLESIGTTYEGRDMWILRITGAPDTTKVPRMLIFGLVHAREWISMELPHHLIKKLVEGYATDPSIKELVDTHAFWIMPITNPDGLAYSQSEYKMWRKNRSKRSGNKIGVDVNRNFEVGWGTGSSASPGSDVYRGPEANSEEETRALLALVQRERFNVSLSFHSYSELILYPWGHSRSDPPGKDTLARHGKAMSATNTYRPGSVAQILYTAGGATDDTFFARHGCWSWTFELARQFVPPDREIPKVCEQNWPAVLHLMKATDELAATPPPPAPAQVPEERFADLYRALSPAAH